MGKAARITAKEIGSISTILLRDRIIEHHDTYGLDGEGVEGAVIPRRGVSSDFLAYSDHDGKRVMYAITSRAVGGRETFITHWAATARGAAEELAQNRHDAQLGYVFAATRAQEPRTIHYLVVPPNMLYRMMEEGIVSFSDAGRITANFQEAIVVHSGMKGWERDHRDKLLFRVDL